MERLKARSAPVRRALWIALLYLVFGWLWITFSDAMVARWFVDPQALKMAQTYKGGLFVLVTGLVLFALIYRQLSKDRTLLSLHARQRDEILRLNRFREKVIDQASVWINVLDSNGRIVLWNRAAEEITGYSRDEVMHSDGVWELMYPDPDVRNQILAKVAEVLRDEDALAGFETTIITKQGQERVISWYTSSLGSVEGESAGTIAIGQDVTDIRAAENLIRRRDRQLVTLMDNLPGMAYRCLYDEHWTMKFVSSGCQDLTGYQPDELVDNRVVSYASLIHGGENDRLMSEVESAIGSAEPFSLEYPIDHKDGQQIWVWERGRAVVDEDELVLEGIIIDITDRKKLEDELSEMATRDALTGLLDRREATRLLDDEIVRARRYGRSLALLWIDLDHFKQVNDQLGHAAGDTVLRGFSELLSSRVRQVDLVSRFGGEEFVVVLPEMDATEASQSAERLRELVASSPQQLGDGREVNLTMSVGVAIYPDHGDDASSLIAAADQAMYQAKASGRNRVVVASAVNPDHTSKKNHEG
ncbi:sensor domain-containing diguanylate cyclase [Marinobacter confluentis]|uniref:GGDEF domain-containing protein n=1 Tax=Marinobacter confluentis TaxID=1697557 RepID=A0A4Z1BPJ2_9GAMM|nr:GGDEF domain-containing protein [Marinobacter confluentis]TGN39407.1 GGDEF domain-containing protein [Marinobacter confluentis]